MDDIEKQARELLAASHRKRVPRSQKSKALDAGFIHPDDHAAMDAIVAALSAAPQGVLEQHHRDSAELRRLCADRDQQRADKLEMAADAASWAEEAGRLKALLNDAQVLPDGWVLVPAVPTPQMVRAGAGEVLISRLEASKVWAAMLAAKPEPPK